MAGSTTLDTIPVGSTALVTAVNARGLTRRRLLDLGLVPGTRVKVIRRSPMGDPVAFNIRGAVIALRREESSRISAIRENFAIPVAENQPVIALAGNPNTGKTTVFNALTGLRQHTGNWPGKTVLQTKGSFIHRGRKYTLVDLPGTYSLLASSIDEQVARDFICFARPDATIVVVDATCLERNLNLVLQITEITGRVILCLNLIDEARRKKININIPQLSRSLGIPVVATAAREKEGLAELLDVTAGVVSGRIKPEPLVVRYQPEVEAAISRLEPRIKALLGDEINPRWVALRLLDGDTALIEALEKFYGRERICPAREVLV